MIDQQEIDLIKSLIEEFFNKTGFNSGISSIEKKENLLEVEINTDEAQCLIGKQGLVLADIQLLLRKIIKKKIDKSFYISIDIDNYKKNKESYLKDLAWSVANEVLKTGVEKEIPLVSSFDRRVIHLELEQRNDVFTESTGDGDKRKIIVKPVK